MKDRELENFLQELRTPQPDEVSLMRWKSAVKKELKQSRPFRRWLELTVAVMVGVIVGAIVFGHKTEVSPENYAENATIEVIITKSQ